MKTRRLALERRLAPHVDPLWTEAVLLELRMRNVPGDTIGAALAEVDSHCAESGEPAAEAFGEPVAYARSLDLPTGPELGPRALLVGLVPTTLQVLGMLLVVWAVPDLFAGEPLTFTVGAAAVLGLLTVEGLLLVRFADAFLAAVVQRPVLSWLVGMVVFAAPIALFAFLTAPLATVPAPAGIAGGALLLAAGTVAAYRDRSTTTDDPVVPPIGAAPDSRLARALAAGTIWLVPTATAVLAASAWLLTPTT